MRYLICVSLLALVSILVGCQEHPNLPAVIVSKTVDIWWDSGKINKAYYYVVVRDEGGFTTTYEVTQADYDSYVVGQRWDTAPNKQEEDLVELTRSLETYLNDTDKTGDTLYYVSVSFNQQDYPVLWVAYARHEALDDNELVSVGKWRGHVVMYYWQKLDQRPFLKELKSSE